MDKSILIDEIHIPPHLSCENKKTEKEILACIEIIKKYHGLLEEPEFLCTTMDTENLINREGRYSKRKRFPKLNHVAGERILYKYKKGILAETLVYVKRKNISKYKLVEAKFKKLKKPNINNKSLSQKERKVVCLKPLTEKSSRNLDCKILRILVIKPGSDNIIKLHGKEFKNINVGDEFEVNYGCYYSVKNNSKSDELIIDLSYE